MNTSVYSVTKELMFKFSTQLDNPSVRAILSKLRNSIGKEISQSVDIWPYIYEKLPLEFISNNYWISDEEKAIISTLQIYAIHQQGVPVSVALQTGDYYNLGNTLGTLRVSENRTAIDRRFNTMITSTSLDELLTHMRHLIGILKSKDKDTKIDYAQLAQDLFWFEKGYGERVKLSWAREYYKYRIEKKEGSNLNE